MPQSGAGIDTISLSLTNREGTWSLSERRSRSAESYTISRTSMGETRGLKVV